MRILIIEDEPKAIAYLRKGLTENGFVVDAAQRGDDGLHQALSVDYDLIVLDVMVPGMDGWSVISNLRRRCRTGTHRRRLLAIGRREAFALMAAWAYIGRERSSQLMVQAAMDVTQEKALIATYRRNLVLVLGLGLILSMLIGAGIVRRGLRPLRETAIRLNPKNAKAHASLGITLADLNELDKAEESLREAVRLNPMEGIATEALEELKKARARRTPDK